MIVPLSPDRYRVVVISPYRTQTPKDVPVTEEELKLISYEFAGLTSV